MNRNNTTQWLATSPAVSILIIGAGINGIGTFRDLALQGVDVLLVDRADFGAGASAASSHMVHGGIRYLENGEFRLVQEAVHERNRLLQNAPHYVKPLATTIPIFSRFSGLLNAPLKFAGLLDRPSERGALVIKIGLMLYDAYTRDQGTVPPHEFTNRKQSLARYPELNPDIRYTATYYDAAMPTPERICLELVLDGEALHDGARAINYVSAVGASGAAVELRDEISGATYSVRPDLVINAAGPWIDFANDALGRSTNFIGGTKGSHLVLDHPELRRAIGEHEFFFENDDGRIVLIYPFLERVMIGTSDIAIDNPDDARCTEEEIDYFLGMVKKVFPEIYVGREHIVFRFSGVRPLPASDANTTGQISRDHHNQVLAPAGDRPYPIFNLVGGKWTTFRAFAEHVADEALAHLNVTRRADTRTLAIGGGRDYPATDTARNEWLTKTETETGVGRERLAVLLRRYGTRAALVAAALGADDAPLAHLADYSRDEIAFLATAEKVVHIDDICLRRSLMGMQGRLTGPLLAELADVVGAALGWSDEQRAAELERTRALLKDRHALDL